MSLTGLEFHGGHGDIASVALVLSLGAPYIPIDILIFYWKYPSLMKSGPAPTRMKFQSYIECLHERIMTY